MASTSQPLLLEGGEATGWRRTQHLIDAMPYIDTLNDQQKQEVEAMLEAEEEHHKLLHAELARVAAQQDLNALDATRYRLDKPAEAQRDDPEAWQQAVDNAKSQLQHQHNRLLNLELMVKYGPNAWRAHNEGLDACHKRLEKEIADTMQQTETLNQSRKLQQLDLKKTLTALEEEWRVTVQKNVAIERECAALEARIAALRAEKGLPERDPTDDAEMAQ